MPSALVHLAAGIGNIVLATPLLIALEECGFAVDVRIDGDYPGMEALLDGWSAVRRVSTEAELSGSYDFLIPAVPPFYWSRFSGLYRGRSHLPRPADDLFYSNEQAYYMEFARAVGFTGEQPFYRLPVPPGFAARVTAATVVLAPGCKTGEMAAKRWPGFSGLAARLPDVAVVGTADDLGTRDGTRLEFPRTTKLFVGCLSLRETAELLATAGAVVGNDSGLSHLAAAVGTPTLMIFGPTPDRELGLFPPNARIIRRGLPCEPCWFRRRFAACDSRIDCLRELSVNAVAAALEEMLSAAAGPSQNANFARSEKA
jgi:ADP-heptose:LPS heptosyltransferase